MAGKATSPTHGDSPPVITSRLSSLFAGRYHTIYSWHLFLTPQTYSHTRGVATSRVPGEPGMFEVWHLRGQKKRKPDIKARWRGRAGHKVSQDCRWPNRGYLHLDDTYSSWDLRSDHGDRRGTDLGITPRVFSVLQYSSLSLLASYFRLNSFSLQFCSFWKTSALVAPWEEPPVAAACRKQSHLLIPGTAALSPSAGLPHGICCPKRAACIPAGAAATHGLCTKRRPGNRHPALCENAGCCPSFSLPVIAQQLWNALLTDVYN